MAEIFRKGTNPIWGVIMLIYVLTALGLNFFWLFTESGPILWLARIEAVVFSGNWFPKLTFLILTICEIGVLLAVKIVFEKISGKRLTDRQE